ncbi:hypothetical protein D3C71_1716640 [compost metagenome]
MRLAKRIGPGGALYLDALGAQLRQQVRAERASCVNGEVRDAHAGQRRTQAIGLRGTCLGLTHAVASCAISFKAGTAPARGNGVQRN